MKADTRDLREAQIAEAAYALLSEKGFQGLSMLAVAKRAKASNETLYRWYGDKLGLFRALIARNVAEVGEALEAADGLEELGRQLLGMLLSPRAVALNRAAAADASNTLGAVLAQAGRGVVFPVLVARMSQEVAAGHLTGEPEALAGLWVDLLVGDWQIRCATGAMAIPGPEARWERAARAHHLLKSISGTAVARRFEAP
ncbi:TetR/AcrR family transcriptional regulator [Tropicibacter alexandrii]|uniref:TetR/AcrR family transcriptional regulator n=1 Tax=Tropicibacter alexandrii TaxID=2267683 RepID=UPI000EF4A56E|nr:TetR/AcrR family transcriptional regulator [Tropicibacter alexandrii]